jgi:hypothetical protein
VLRDQPELFGAVASYPTTWQVLAGIDDGALARLRAAHAAAREVAWAQTADTRGVWVKGAISRSRGAREDARGTYVRPRDGTRE